MRKPIVQSLLDTDFYKLTMGQLVFLKHKDVPVRYEYTNRTREVRIADWVDVVELRRQLEHVRMLRFQEDELAYLRSLTLSDGRNMFLDEYLEFLQNLQLPDFEVGVVDGQFSMKFSGRWAEAIYWETHALPIVNELYYRELIRRGGHNFDDVYQEGIRRLDSKIETIKAHKELLIVEFGTRRRSSVQWQRKVIKTFAEELGAQYLGTSNVRAAMDLGHKSIGTLAHEMFMVYASIYHGSDVEVRASHNKVLQDWWEVYGRDLSVALSDTFGTDFFFEDMTHRQARDWKGLRHDSGSPFEFVDKVLAFYRACNLEAAEHMTVFSDGLTVEKMIEIVRYIEGRIPCSFGWGTNATNDMGFKPISHVIKAVWADGNYTCKLSDNLAKAQGPVEVVERFKKIFGHTVTLNEPLVY